MQTRFTFRRYREAGRQYSLFLILPLCLATLCCSSPDLREFEEKLARTNDERERRQIMHSAVRVLEKEQFPDFIAARVDSYLVKKQSTSLSLPECLMGASEWRELDDSLGIRAETCLMNFSRRLIHIPFEVLAGQRDSLRMFASPLAEKVDAWSGHVYWQEFVHFLLTSAPVDYQQWRRASAAASTGLLGFDAERGGHYEVSMWSTLYGLRCANSLPHPVDRRLVLDLRFRLQEAVFFSRGFFYFSNEFATWIIDEAQQMGYHFRAAGMSYILANELIYDQAAHEAIDHLEHTRRLIRQWGAPGDSGWDFYAQNVLERLSVAYRRLGEPNQANELIEEYYKQSKARRDTVLYNMSKGEIEQDLGQLGAAEGYFRRAHDLAGRPVGDTASVIGDEVNFWIAHVNLAELYLQMGKPDLAQKSLNEWNVCAPKRENNLRPQQEAIMLHRQAAILMQLDDLASARTQMRRANELTRPLNSRHLTVRGLRLNAELHKLSNDMQQAFNSLEQARRFCEANNLFREELQVIVEQAALEREDLPAEQVMAELHGVAQRARRFGDQPQLLRTLSWLIHYALESKLLGRAEEYAHELLEEAELSSLQHTREGKLVYFRHSVYPSIKAAIAVDVQMGRKAEAFWHLARAKGRALQQELGLAPFAETQAWLADLQNAIEDTATLLDYMIMRDTTYVFVLSRDGLDVESIPVRREALLATVERYVDLLKDDTAIADPNAYRDLFAASLRAGREVYASVFAQVQPHVDKKNKLYIIPDEHLHALPFAAIVLDSTQQEEFLLEKWAVMYLPSAGMFKAPDSLPKASPEKKLAALIDLSFKPAEELQQNVEALVGGRAQVVNAVAGKKDLANLLEAGFQTYLIFSHAKGDLEEPENSYVRIPLHDKSAAQFNYSEIDKLRMADTQLMILAACESAGNSIYLGAGLSGLQRAFLAAGVQQVLATYWRASDSHTADIVKRFLSHYLQQKDPAWALQQAQLATIEEMKKLRVVRVPLPQFWASYGLTTRSVQNTTGFLASTPEIGR